ncbi:sigma 54-interacting transcriptional regulator [Nannocystis sp. RBIL2]|uniref:sigma 54-interacting transcriptional regulator n=1 Tax=unclassified Nannocystis TaxID=2627009 RepID=UPI00320B9BA6
MAGRRDEEGAELSRAKGETAVCEGGRGGPLDVRRFRLSVIEGPARGLVWQSSGPRCSIGAHRSNDLVLDDSTVSRFHCEVVAEAGELRVLDLQSRNGTVLDGVQVRDARARAGSVVRLGKSALQLELSAEMNEVPLSEATSFGSLSGVSPVMRATFALLERAAESDVTLLLEGETGTGKSQAAQSLHRAGARKKGPFVIVDCGAIHGNLLESELFGHEKGAFTGASERRIGAFEEASGGTLFLDEVGELPLDLQPKLLRALEAREVRRVGANSYRPVDVRVVAATNRDLRADVNAGRFRADLYFRLAVITIHMPPLRRRPEDMPALVDDLLASLAVRAEVAEPLRAPGFVARLQQAAWSGNVRELRNYLERCAVLRTIGPLAEQAGPVAEELVIDASQPYAAERQRIIAEFERGYFERLLRLHGGKVARAAEAAGVDRTYIYRLLRRHGIEQP